jgi:putative flippase GtrA
MCVKLLGNIWKNLFRNNSKNYYIQIFRYLLSGLFAFIADAFILYTLTEYFNFHYLLSTVLAYSVGVFVSYIMNIVWVFDKRKQERQSIEMLIFILITLIGLLITYVLMWYFTSKLEIYYLFSKVITTILVFIWNFLMKKRILF